jgi:hypothetical protein
MKNRKSGSDVTITLPADQLAFISNAINEALEGVEEWEFETRTGKSPTEAKALYARLRQILDDAG